jgi:hypothetical protein
MLEKLGMWLLGAFFVYVMCMNWRFVAFAMFILTPTAIVGGIVTYYWKEHQKRKNWNL